MTAHVYKVMEDIRQEIRDEGRQEGIQAGRQEGIQEGRAEPLVRALGRKLGAPLSQQQREALLGRVAQLDDDALLDLITDVVGGRASEVAQVLGLEPST